MDTPSSKEIQNNYRPYTIDMFTIESDSAMQIYLQKCLELPDSLSAIMHDAHTADFIDQNLGNAFQLSEEQKSKITRVIRDVLIKDVALRDFNAVIQQKLNIDSATAQHIGSYILSNLFSAEALLTLQQLHQGPIFEPKQPIQENQLPLNRAQQNQPNRAIIEPRVKEDQNVVNLRNNK